MSRSKTEITDTEQISDDDSAILSSTEEESDQDSDNNSEKSDKSYDFDDSTSIGSNDSCIHYFANLKVDEKKEIVFVSKNDRITNNKLTKFEFVRLLSERSKHLSEGAPSTLKIKGNMSYEEIARKEIMDGSVPLTIIRPLRNNHYEYWDVEELDRSYI